MFSDPIKTIIYRTTNAGVQWDSVTSKLNRVYVNIECLPSTGTAFGVGNLIDTIEFFANIATIKTTNYGASWVGYKVPTQHSTGLGVSLIDQNNFMMCSGDLNVIPYIPESIQINKRRECFCESDWFYCAFFIFTGAKLSEPV